MRAYTILLAALVVGGAHVAEASDAVTMLPVQFSSVGPKSRGRIANAFVDLLGERDITVVPSTDPMSCWHATPCYLEGAIAAKVTTAFALELTSAGKNRFDVSIVWVDTKSGEVRRLPKVRVTSTTTASLKRALAATADDAAKLIIATPTPVPDPPLGILPPPTPKPVDPPAPKPVDLPPARLHLETEEPWYLQFAVNAFVSTSATWNLNRASTHTNTLRTFDAAADVAQLDIAELVVQHGVSEPHDTGFRVDLTADPSHFDLQQAFVSYIAHVGAGIRVDAGKFVTPVGSEVIPGYDGYNDQVSRSFLFGYAIPFTHTGLRLSYPLHDRLAIGALVANGWDDAPDTIHGVTTGLQLVATPHPRVSLALGYLGGPVSDSDRNWRQLGDLVATLHLGPSLVLAGNLDYGREGDARWYGGAWYLTGTITDHVTVGLRTEYFADPDGARTGTAQRLGETTATLALHPGRDFVIRAELRGDRSSDRVFEHEAHAAFTQTTLAVNMLYAR